MELRYFGGLSVDETAEYMGASERTVKRHWRFARAWLLRTLGEPIDGVNQRDNSARSAWRVMAGLRSRS